MGIQATAASGQSDVGMFMDLATGSSNNTTVRKRVAHGSVVRMIVFFDGTNLYYQFDDDEPVVAAFSGTLDPVGTNATILFATGGNIQCEIEVVSAGKRCPDNDAQWAKMLAWSAAIGEQLAA
jgi:hypothetical protein